MTKIEGEITMSRPVELVFDYVADQTTEPQYNPRMVRAWKARQPVRDSRTWNPGPSPEGVSQGPNERRPSASRISTVRPGPTRTRPRCRIKASRRLRVSGVVPR